MIWFYNMVLHKRCSNWIRAREDLKNSTLHVPITQETEAQAEMTAQGVPLVLAAGSGQRPKAGLESQVLVSHPSFLLCYSFNIPAPQIAALNVCTELGSVRPFFSPLNKNRSTPTMKLLAMLTLWCLHSTHEKAAVGPPKSLFFKVEV